MKHIVRIEIDSLRLTVGDGATPEGNIRLEQELSFMSDEKGEIQVTAIRRQLDRLAATAGDQFAAHANGVYR